MKNSMKKSMKNRKITLSKIDVQSILINVHGKTHWQRIKNILAKLT